MADNNFDILIRLQAELAGATESVAALKELKRQAIATGVSTGDLDKQIGNAERTALSFQKKVEEAGSKGKGHIEGLHRAVGLLGRQFGEAGMVVAHFGASLPALGVAALALGVGLVVEHFRKLQEEVDKAQEKLNSLNLARIDALRDSTKEAADAMAAYNLALLQAGHAKDAFAGRKFASPEEELAARTGRQGTLDADAQAALARASNYPGKDQAEEAARQVELAKAESAKLYAAKEKAGKSEDLKQIWESQKGTQGAAFAQQRYMDALAAERAWQINQDAINNGQATMATGAATQAYYKGLASDASGKATGNMSRITAVRETLAENERQRRGDWSGQLQAGGIGSAQANQIVGGSAAADRMRNGERVTGMDAVDYNAMLNQVKAGMFAAFLKTIQEVFADGVATPEEIEKIKALLKNQSQRP